MRFLLRLYPRDWRRHYGLEMEALLHQMRGRRRSRIAVDLLRGAVDAHLHPQRPRRPRLRWLVAALGLLAATLASHALTVGLGAAGAAAVSPTRTPFHQDLPPNQALSAWLLAGLWLAAAVAWRWLGSRTLSLFSLLVAVRFAADWFLLGLAVAVTHSTAAAPWHWIAASLVEVLLWAGAVVLVLRGTRLPWAVALAAGCVLELVLGSTGLSLAVLLEQALTPVAHWRANAWDWGFLPGYVDPLRIALWAAAVAGLARLRRPRPWIDPREGAPVSARPAPDAPEPLLVRSRRAS